MKAFIASLILLAVLAASSVLSCLYVEKTVDRLTELEGTFPKKEEEGEASLSSEILGAREIWFGAIDRLSCTVGLKYVNAVTLSLESLCDFYCHGSPADYIAARHTFLRALEALRCAEKLSLLGII